jgi:hypothetical protein
MPLFIIETTAESPIREFWQVEAESAQQARDKFEAGQVGAFLWDEVMGDETEREVAQVHPRADLAGTISLHNAQQEAPAMLAALRDAMEELQAWRSKYHPIQWPDKPVVHTATRDKIRAILSRIDGTPTAQPAGDDPAVTAAANLSRAGLAKAAGEALALQAPISEAGRVQTFTAFCQEADGTGTIWIQQVKAETIADAVAAARRDCAEDWGFDVEHVHCLGLALGDCQIVHWEDAAP